MAKKIYTDEMKDYMKEIVPNRRMNEVTKLMNSKFGTEFTVQQLTNLKSRLKLKNGLPTKVKGENKMFSDQQEAFIHQHYKGVFNKELTDLVNKQFGTNYTTDQIKAYKARNKLDSGIGGHFVKGQVPFNKGLKQEDFMSKEAIENTKKTRFKKGQSPTNYQPIGYERVSVDGYVEVKIRDEKGVHSTKNFELKHRYIWEQEHGKIPKNHVVLFKNGNKQDIRLDNLILIDRATLLHLNKQELLTEYPELNEVAVNLVKLQLKTNRIKEESK